ncbi:MAG: hypothetical protein ACAH89_11770 [Rariglobus sp.]
MQRIFRGGENARGGDGRGAGGAAAFAGDLQAVLDLFLFDGRFGVVGGFEGFLFPDDLFADDEVAGDGDQDDMHDHGHEQRHAGRDASVKAGLGLGVGHGKGVAASRSLRRRT